MTVSMTPETARELSRASKQIRAFTQRRDEYVLKARAEGASLRDIAKKAELSHRAIAKIIDRKESLIAARLNSPDEQAT